MTHASGSSANPGNLNPLAFPSTTDSRFALLVLAVIASTTFIYNWLALWLPEYKSGLVGVVQGCSGASAAAATALTRAIVGGLQYNDSQVQATQAYNDCVADFWLRVGLWSLSGLPLLAAIAILFYWLIPKWIIGRRGLSILDEEDAAELLQALRRLSHEIGLDRAPTFFVAPGYRSTGALAFGRHASRAIAFDSGLITQFYTQPERFRAVVLHELAHIANGDLDKTYLTLAAGAAFVVVGLIPLGASLVGQPWSLALGMIVRAAGLSLLVYLSAAAVLRARECYADARAASFEGAQEALESAIGSADAPPLHWIRRATRLHLDPATRTALLANSLPLFKAAPFEAFAAGIAVAVVLPRIYTIASALATRATNSTIAPTTAALVLAPVLVGTVGLAIWRASFAHALRAAGQPPYARIAWAVAAGLVVGQLLAFEASFEIDFDAVGFLVVELVWGILLALTLYAYLRWMAVGAATWFAATRAVPSRPASWLGLGLVTFELVVLAMLLFFIEAIARSAVGTVVFGLFGAVAAVFLAIGGAGLLLLFQVPLLSGAGLIALWLYPIGAAIWAGSRTRRDAEQRRTVEAIRSGIVGGVVFATVDLIVNIQYGNVPAEVRSAPETKLLLFSLIVALAVGLQAAVAGFVAWRSNDLRAAHGLLAAFVTGVLSAVAFLVINIAYGGSVDGSYVVTVYVSVVSIGALSASACVGLVTLVQTAAGADRPAVLGRVSAQEVVS